MLYDGAIKFVQQAREAMEKGDIETRYNSLTKACDILAGLQLSLDFDKGGEIAKLLYDYYAGLDMRLMSLHADQNMDICESCIRHLKMMREAWQEVDTRHSGGDTVEQEESLYDPSLAAPLNDSAGVRPASEDSDETPFEDYDETFNADYAEAASSEDYTTATLSDNATTADLLDDISDLSDDEIPAPPPGIIPSGKPNTPPTSGITMSA